MNSIYIGDRPLDPPEDDECETCNGEGVLFIDCAPVGFIAKTCPDCFCDSDPGEPNEEPDL